MEKPKEQHKLSFSEGGIWLKMIISIIVLTGIGFVFSKYPTEFGEEWYHQLTQPSFAPPYWLPFVMWSLVYMLMGCSAGIIWQVAVKSSSSVTTKFAKQGIILFILHLTFNLFFPVLLIGLHLPKIALADMIILIIFIGILIRHFFYLNRLASYLLIPYLIWIIYAAILNISIIVLN